MSLPTNFQFSQASLSDYADCARRFQLRYLLEQPWPAVQAEPLLERERVLALGQRFHKLIQQHIEGLPVETLTQSLAEPEIMRWWQSYLRALTCPNGGAGSHARVTGGVGAASATDLNDLPAQRRAEVALSIPVGLLRLTPGPSPENEKQFSGEGRGPLPLSQNHLFDFGRGGRGVRRSNPVGHYRLVAHCDLIAADDDRAVIVDWKTEHRRPTHEQVLNRLQTRVYRYVVTEAQQRAPGAVSMLYWFAEYPDQPEVLPYDARQHVADQQFFVELIAEIEQRAQSAGEWPKTVDDRKCAYCTYRSLCNRGVVAGTSDPDDEDMGTEIVIDLAELEEIAY
jgi:hypothetical protein